MKRKDIYEFGAIEDCPTGMRWVDMMKGIAKVSHISCRSIARDLTVGKAEDCFNASMPPLDAKNILREDHRDEAPYVKKAYLEGKVEDVVAGGAGSGEGERTTKREGIILISGMHVSRMSRYQAQLALRRPRRRLHICKDFRGPRLGVGRGLGTLS